MSLSLGKNIAIQEMKTLMADMRTRTEISDDEFATRLIGLLFDWITKANIKYTDGLTAPNGPVTGTINGKLE